MSQYEDLLNSHYGQSGLADRIFDALRRSGKDIHSLTCEDITAVDQFHVRGLEATRELARLAGLHEGVSVLDLGCGVGGPARTLAAEFGCRVTGVDIVEEHCRTARILTERVGLGDRVTFRQGDVTAIPLGDRSFDMVWIQHMNMNIGDKQPLFNEIARVLRPGGRLALYEICAGPVSPVHFPVPWAGDPSISFLVSPETLRRCVGETGLVERIWKDVTQPSFEWFQRLAVSLEARPENAPPLLDMNLLMGRTSREKAVNTVRNLREDRIKVVQGLFERPGRQESSGC